MKLRDIKPQFPSGLQKWNLGGIIMHVDEPSLGRFAKHRSSQGAGVLLSTKRLPLQSSRKQKFSPSPTAQLSKSC